MRRLFAILGLVVLGAVGCKHVGGKCDCGPTPGEHVLYAPMQGYPVAPGTPIMTQQTGVVESVGSPRPMQQMPR